MQGKGREQLMVLKLCSCYRRRQLLPGGGWGLGEDGDLF